MAANISLFKTNGLAFPGRKPGFDPSHPASGNCRFSAVATPSTNFRNILKGGAPGTIGGSPTSAVLGGTGPSVLFPSGASVQFANQSARNDSAITLAAIIVLTANNFAATECIFTTSSSSGGYQLDLNSTFHLFLNVNGVANISSGFTFTNASTGPYFVAISSVVAGTANFVAIPLTGIKRQILSSSTTGPTSASAPNGTYEIGNNTSTQAALCYIAAVMFSAQYMTLGALLAWGADPWAFWYPRSVETLIFDSLATQVAAATVTQRFLPIMGVGR